MGDNFQMCIREMGYEGVDRILSTGGLLRQDDKLSDFIEN
jgi:hypothetical protein